MSLYENLLVLAGIVLAVALLRASKRQSGVGRGYALVVGLELALALAALVGSDRYFGVVALCLCALTVVLPAVLERAARELFARARPRLAVRMAGLRALLMPGAGLGRQQQILAGFAVLDRDGADAALAHFRGLIAAAEDPAELAVLHEQIVAMLLHDRRFGEALGHYEKHFHAGFAALRPGLALGMLRAYGELGRADEALALLRALEGGPLAREPSAAEILAQARLIVLAYGGASERVEAALAVASSRRFGLSPAAAELLLAAAYVRAGPHERARALLERVTSGARREPRVLAEARGALARAWPPPAPASPELARELEEVARRLLEALALAPPRVLQPLIMTTALIVVSAGAFAVALAAGRAGVGLLRAGALTPELLRDGSWWRVFTAPFVHADLLSLLLTCYSLWLAGHVLERIHGWARTGLIALAAASAGMYVAAAAGPNTAQLLGGGGALATAVLVATLWTLAPAHTPGLATKVRRSVALTLLILLAAHLFANLPGDFGLRASPLALGTSAFVASLLALLLPNFSGRAARLVTSGLCVGLVGVGVASAALVSREDPIAHALAHRLERPALHEVRLALPLSFEPVRAAGERRHPALPVLPGFVDVEALRLGHLIQVLVARDVPDDGTAILRLDESLGRSLVVRRDDAAPAPLDALPSYTLQLNGEAVARVVERELGDRRVLLLAAPPEALEQAPELYAAILGDARRSP